MNFKTWIETDQGATVNMRPNGPPRPSPLTQLNIAVGSEVRVRLHPNDPYPSIGWKVIKILDKTVIVQKPPSFGVGGQQQGDVGGTLIIPTEMFISMVLNDKPPPKKFNQIPYGQEQVNSMVRRRWY